MKENLPKDRQLFLNEKLTPSNRRLLWLMKLFKKEYQYRYVWTKDGKLFMKRDETANTVRIVREAQLQKMDTAGKLKDAFSRHKLEVTV